MPHAFTIFTDNGHGWLRVNRDDCAAINLNAQSFSKYSYVKGNDFYLEEDCDASKFIAAYVAALGEMPVIHCEHVSGASPIRRYRRLIEA